MKDYKQLTIWKRSHALALEVYRCTAKFPAEERFGLTSQIRRAALSVPSNIAEGCGRFERGDLRRFIDYAAGSSKELEYQLLVAHDLHYLATAAFTELSDELDQIQRMLRAFRNRLTKT